LVDSLFIDVYALLMLMP